MEKIFHFIAHLWWLWLTTAATSFLLMVVFYKWWKRTVKTDNKGMNTLIGLSKFFDFTLVLSIFAAVLSVAILFFQAIF